MFEEVAQGRGERQERDRHGFGCCRFPASCTRGRSMNTAIPAPPEYHRKRQLLDGTCIVSGVQQTTQTPCCWKAFGEVYPRGVFDSTLRSVFDSDCGSWQVLWVLFLVDPFCCRWRRKRIESKHLVSCIPHGLDSEGFQPLDSWAAITFSKQTI